MSNDFTMLSIVELEGRVLAAGEFLVAADLEAGIDGEGEWFGAIDGAMRELLRRGTEGEATVFRLLDHTNPEVALVAASMALDAGLEPTRARSTLQKLKASSVANGWPALYAHKVLERHNEQAEQFVDDNPS